MTAFLYYVEDNATNMEWMTCFRCVDSCRLD
uniref:4Fe-4S ferredoxin-type domain-containing protein n=1 Tax=Heterorhabditis bacteriophora TaxID=37862 RepID=A0A1I7WVU9_HETBA